MVAICIYYLQLVYLMSCSLHVAWLIFDFMKRKKRYLHLHLLRLCLQLKEPTCMDAILAASLEKEIRRHGTTEANNRVATLVRQLQLDSTNGGRQEQSHN